MSRTRAEIEAELAVAHTRLVKCIDHQDEMWVIKRYIEGKHRRAQRDSEKAGAECRSLVAELAALDATQEEGA